MVGARLGAGPATSAAGQVFGAGGVQTPDSLATGQERENRGMPDGLAFISMIAGFGFVIVAGAKIGAGSHTALVGLFATEGARDWPTGVQEADAPRFVFARSSVVMAVTSAAGDIPASDVPLVEVEELYAGPLRSLH